MKIAINEMKTQFDTYITACLNEPIVLTEQGQIVAVLLSVRDEEQLEKLILMNSSKFQKILETGKQEIKDGKGVSHEDFWKQIEALSEL